MVMIQLMMMIWTMPLSIGKPSPIILEKCYSGLFLLLSHVNRNQVDNARVRCYRLQREIK
jgi:hypothetical protein